MFGTEYHFNKLIEYHLLTLNGNKLMASPTNQFSEEHLLLTIQNKIDN